MSPIGARRSLPLVTALSLLVSVSACGSADTISAPEGSGGKADSVSEDERDRFVISAIAGWNHNLSDADRREKYCRMAASPFAFYRGSNHLFWSDFAGGPPLPMYSTPETRTWLQGDLHARNIGVFDDDEARIMLGVNDFDESVVADVQYDILRMATSLVLVAQANDQDAAASSVVDAFVSEYQKAMADFADSDDELGSFEDSVLSGRLNNLLDQVESAKSRSEMLDDWTRKDGSERHFDLDNPELEAASPAEMQALQGAMTAYRQTLSSSLAAEEEYFEVLDIARRIGAGTGSLGTPRYYMLIRGESDEADDDRILDWKRQSRPTPYFFLDLAHRSDIDALSSQGQRHQFAARALLPDADDHLGWAELPDGDYSVRERSPFKASLDLEDFDSRSRLETLAAVFGRLVARSHARADQDFEPQQVGHSVDDGFVDAIRGEKSEMIEDMIILATLYTEIVTDDYEVFVEVLASDCPAPPTP